MAQGTVTMFQAALDTIGLGEWNMNTDQFNIALLTAVTTPATGDADPGMHASRTTNFLSTEIATAGNYTQGGGDITNTYSQTSGVGKFDAADHTILAQNASNPTVVRWGIIYNTTDTDKKAIGFIDLGANFDASTGDITVAWDASGVFTFTIV
jgi:hypothetical protein